jgi:hypothetical protein
VTRRTGTPAAVRVKGVKLVKGVGLVRGEPLPNTGAPTGQLLALGLALLGVGLGCCRQARRLGAR